MILSRAKGRGLQRTATPPGRDETRSVNPFSPYTGGLVLAQAVRKTLTTCRRTNKLLK